MIITIDTDKKTLLVSGNINRVESVSCSCFFNVKRAMIGCTFETFEGKNEFSTALRDKMNTTTSNCEKSLLYFNKMAGD